ncbi:sensor histidine kinase [Microbacterium abyssi]|uniref:sensor histidine kinase n=1 Tax=Microbacterium abyssi TaxID=2782166 RepID=UPI0018873F37|nr:histidine kinase [Microbacterium sp. A18JL241]
MHTQEQVVPYGLPVEDDLRLPRPPGVVRRFWARHPRLGDALLVALTLLLSITSTLVGSDLPAGVAPRIAGAVVVVLTSVSLMWRRRRPLLVFIVTFSPLIILSPAVSTSIVGIAPLIALYSVAVHRSTRAAMWTLVAAIASSTLAALTWGLFSPIPPGETISVIVGTTFLLMLGALIGSNVGGRKRYVEALIERSRQLTIERDQHAQLAAAAERSRIAREMHDIVSHSLAVVVTLAEGAHATDDPAQSKQASRAIADTARDALMQMRAMLGVLRTEPDAEASAVPREPLLTLTPADVVDTARAAGLPVTLTVTGTPSGSDPQRLAVLRIVQEGLTNALRYAHDPRAVAVVIDYTGGRVRVQIDNDGIRDGEPSRGAGLGLRGLQERVVALSGTVHAGRRDESSWRLIAEFPLEVIVE